jgi:hypothetical protein
MSKSKLKKELKRKDKIISQLREELERMNKKVEELDQELVLLREQWNVNAAAHPDLQS